MPQVGEHVVLSWDPLTSMTESDGQTATFRNEVKHYEVRRGANWTFGKRVICTPCTSFRTRDWCVGTETYFVRAMLNTGHYTRPQSVSVATATPTIHSDAASRDEVSLTWPGSHSATAQTADDYLTLGGGETAGTYTSPEIDMGSLGWWRVGIMMHGECEKRSLKWSGVTWEDAALSGLTWADMQETFGQWNYRGWESQLATELDWNGNNFYNPTASFVLTSTVYTATGVPGTYITHRPGLYYGRYLKFKVAITRGTADDVTVTDATNASPINIEAAGHGFVTGQTCNIHSVAGNTAANGQWQVTKVDADNFTLDDSTGNGAYTSGGVVVKTEFPYVSKCFLTYSKPPQGDVRAAGTETISGDWTFTTGPKIQTVGSYPVQLLNTAEAAARTASIPTLGANDTFAMLGVTQTFTGIPTFSNGVQGELGILSTDKSDKIRLFHNNTDAFMKWNDGNLTLATDEGTNSNGIVYIKGKGTGLGNLFVFDGGAANYLDINCNSGYGQIAVNGSGPVNLVLQGSPANVDAEFFKWVSSGQTAEVRIWGYRTSDAARALEIGVGVDAADQASFDGVSNYFFDGNVKATNDFYSGGSQGVTSTFVNGDGDTVTVTGGIITAITPP